MFHNDYGHNIDDCNHPKDETKRLILAGHLKSFINLDKE